MEEGTTLRRSVRGKKKSQKLYETSSDESDEDNFKTDELRNRHSQVLFEEQDVSGKKMFGFHTYKKRGGLLQKASEVANNLHKTGTPTTENINESPDLPPKTPHALRQKIKKGIAALVRDSTDEDFSASESDFKPSESSSTESTSEDKSDNSDSTDSNSTKEKEYKPSVKYKSKSQNSMNTNTRSNKDQTYVMKSDDYFSWQANSKIITSNHTLQKLKNPKLSEDELQKLLSSCNLKQSKAHSNALHEILQINCNYFNKWMYVMHEGFNVLLYGLGSKRDILKAFQTEILTSDPVIVVNGYFPGLTIKDIVEGVLVDIFNESTIPGNLSEAVELVRDYCRRFSNKDFYLIIHNIDGPMLRNNKSQNVLSSFAHISNFHLLASIDHINTPLIWDHSKLSKFNFTWWDVTSFLPYTDETSFESSMLVQRSGALALSSLTNVYQSLTKNSKGVFMLIVKYQLANKSVKHYQGMPFKVLYSQCRENFLVSSDLALRAQLTEFLDHKLMKTKRSVDGTELVHIPIHNSLLQQFLEQKS